MSVMMERFAKIVDGVSRFAKIVDAVSLLSVFKKAPSKMFYSILNTPLIVELFTFYLV